MDASDQHLLSDFLGGREQAFRELSERHMNLVYGVAMRNTADPSIAEEVVQDVFVLLAKKARRLASHPCIAGWLHNTSRNVARDARRKRLGHQKKLARFAEETRAGESPQDGEHLEEIDTAVKALPAKERDAILLRFFEDRDYREIATHLAISEPAARKRVSRGIQRLHSGLQTKLAAGTALALIAPGHLTEAVASSIATTAAPVASTTIATSLAMTKTTASIAAACATLLIGTLGFIAADQSSKRKELAAELERLNQELADLRAGGSKKNLSAVGDYPSDPLASEQAKRIRSLEDQLTAERKNRELAEKEAAAMREATAGLEDEVVIAYGKVEEVGTNFGEIFKEALALSELEKAGKLDDDENKKRLINFSIKAASISGLSKQIIGFDDNPEEGSKFFSSTYKAIFDLDDQTTKSLEKVFAEQLAAAKDRELTLVNNPAFKMLAGDENIDEEQIETWLEKRQEFYRGIREKLRDQVPSAKQAEFDKHVEEAGIGFTNITLKGSPLGFSLGGKQGGSDEEKTEETE